MGHAVAAATGSAERDGGNRAAAETSPRPDDHPVRRLPMVRGSRRSAAGRRRVRDGDQAVWLRVPAGRGRTEIPYSPSARPPPCSTRSGQVGVAGSRPASRVKGRAERLTEHSRADCAAAPRSPVDRPGGGAGQLPAFWALVRSPRCCTTPARSRRDSSGRSGRRGTAGASATRCCRWRTSSLRPRVAGEGAARWWPPGWACTTGGSDSAGGSGARATVAAVRRSGSEVRSRPGPAAGPAGRQVPLRRHGALLDWYADQLGVPRASPTGRLPALATGRDEFAAACRMEKPVANDWDW